MTVDDYVSLISAVGAIGAIIFSYISFQRSSKGDCEQQGEKTGIISSDIKYIMRRTDDIYIDQKELKRETSKSIDNIKERLIRTEESVKLAHQRIDDHFEMTNNKEG